MGRTPRDSLHLRFKESGSTSRIDNHSTSISESTTDVQLPQELITEILLLLPVKSLLKFKCVSKPWFSLISSPQFIRSHFSISSMEGEYLNLQLLFTTRAASMKQCSLYCALREAEPFTHVRDIGFPSQNYFSLIVGIVNGLVCLALGGTDLFLWNPVLKKVKHLPDSNLKPEASFSVVVPYGFGYDESNDDYKVVCLRRKYVAQFPFEDEVMVYRLRADSWRRIDELKGFRLKGDPGVYANGKIYWSGCVSSTPKRKIVSLDMSSEKYGEPEHPNYEAGEYDLELGVLGGRLCVLCDYEGRKADLWVMDKYGVEESWCKVVSIPYGDVDPQMLHNSLQFHRVLCILGSGEIVLAKKFGLLVYNSKKKEFQEIELDVGISSYLKIAAYVESLVWPYA